jgi:hypothetical protein
VDGPSACCGQCDVPSDSGEHMSEDFAKLSAGLLDQGKL